MGKSRLVLKKSDDVDRLARFPPEIIILSWNVMAKDYCKVDVNHTERVQHQLNYLVNRDPDIIFLQEVDTFFKDMLNTHELGNKYFIYESEVEPYGQIILSKYRTKHEVYSFGKTSHKKIQVLEGVCENPVIFVNCHLQARRSQLKQRESQVKKIVDFLGNHVNFILGDLNMVTEEEMIEGYVDLCPEDKRDIYTFNHTENRLTFPAESSNRFDRVYCNRKLDTEYRVLEDVELSDHYPLYCKIML